jgi:hypothetical protein
MRIRFLRDFRSAATKEQFFQAGEVVDFAYLDVAQLVSEGAAEVVEPEPEPEPTRRKRSNK